MGSPRAGSPDVTTCRNGARSWRPGMAHQRGVRVPQTVEPQWSPVLETGNGRDRHRRPAGTPVSRNGARSWRPGMAMPPTRPGWRLDESRNGARSWRPGMAPTSTSGSRCCRGRNGARSWRPGMAAPAVSRCQSPPPQWSPVLETGNGDTAYHSLKLTSRRRNGARSWRPGMVSPPAQPPGGRAGPQWSPVLETGNGSKASPLRFPRAGRNGARSWRPGMARTQTSSRSISTEPQWSPVLETGNGRVLASIHLRERHAAMEPGLGDREWRM